MGAAELPGCFGGACGRVLGGARIGMGVDIAAAAGGREGSRRSLERTIARGCDPSAKPVGRCQPTQLHPSHSSAPDDGLPSLVWSGGLSAFSLAATPIGDSSPRDTSGGATIGNRRPETTARSQATQID
jgi:hypothetical protein